MSDSVRRELVGQAERELQANAADDEWVLRQLALLFTCDAATGVQSLARWLTTAAADREYKQRGEAVFARLFSRHWPLVPDALTNESVDTLKHLLLLAYRTVRIADDVHHEGMYSPGLRDEAESARNHILNALLEVPGRETYEALRELAEEPSISPRAKRFRELAHRRAEHDAERLAWFPREVIAFEHRYVTPAKTGTDLYRITCSVLDDIKSEFYHADATSRLVLQTAKDEQAVQQWLAEQFKLRSKGRYHVDREVEVAGKKEPDILLSSTAGPFQVAVEVKHGGKKWSVRGLEKAVREQLGAQYLRPANRRHGILVITYHGNRTWQDPDTKEIVEFEQLVTRLQGVASTVRKNETGSIELGVVGLDSTMPA